MERSSLEDSAALDRPAQSKLQVPIVGVHPMASSSYQPEAWHDFFVMAGEPPAP